VTLLLLPSFSLAQPTTTGPENKPAILAVGDPAPFAGVLLTQEHVIKLGQRAEGCAKKTAAAVMEITELSRIDLDHAARQLEAQKELAEQREELLSRHVDGAEVWYRQPLFVASMTAALTAAAILTARYTVIDDRR